MPKRSWPAEWFFVSHEKLYWMESGSEFRSRGSDYFNGFGLRAVGFRGWKPRSDLPDTEYFRFKEASSMAQHSSKLLLSHASTVVLGFGPRLDTWPMFVRSETIYVLENEAFSSTREGLFSLSRRHICCTVIQCECIRTHSVQVRAFILHGHRTHFVTSL
jgi:hypothetical protein